jgi:hypothetical protein
MMFTPHASRNHRLLRLAAGLLSLCVWFQPTPSLAQDACERVVTARCQNGKADTRCYEALYACGQYEQLLGHFTGKLEGLPPTEQYTEQYFAGVSYLGLADRQRAQSMKCSFNGYGKAALASFLSKAREQFRTYGNFGDSSLLRYVYQASKSLDIAKQLSGCHEDGHTQATLNVYARTYAEDSLKALFIGGARSREDLKESYQDLLARMQDFVTSASNVETKLALSRLEIDSAKKQLDSIKTDLEKDVGAIHLDPAPGQAVFDQGALRRIAEEIGTAEDPNSPIGRIYTKEAKFKELFSACKDLPTDAAQSCADVYAKNKENTIAAAHNLMSRAASLQNYGQKQFSMTETDFARFTSIQVQGDNMPLGEMQTQLWKVWEQYGQQHKLCDQPGKYWYCHNAARQEAQP